MGMTIDKAIEFFDGLEGHTPQAKDARDVAIDTMRKYQKIEQIAKKSYKNGICCEGCDDWFNKLTAIRKVLEDESESYD